MTSSRPTCSSRLMAARVVAAVCFLAALGAIASATAADGADPAGVWPLVPEPEVATGFNPPLSPYSSGHRGVDLEGAGGQRVRTALPGVVTYAAPLAGRGIVVVSHGSTRTTYQPVTASVSVGATLAAGDPIGRLELLGSHCFPRACLHWGWIEGDTYLDPLRLMGMGPVRLLPLWRDLPVTAPAPLFSSPANATALTHEEAWHSLLQLWT